MPFKCCSYTIPCHKTAILLWRGCAEHFQYPILLSVVLLLEEMTSEKARTLLSHIG